MWVEQSIFREDMEYISGVDFIPWEDLRDSTILITGATGLIGFNLVSALAYIALYKKIPLHILALVRDEEKARERFCELLKEEPPISFIIGDMEHIPSIQEPIDYIIHGGSPTASRYFAEHPVETIQCNLIGAMSLLTLAREKKSKGFIYLSSMEVYGSLHRQEKVDENHETFIDTMNVRNSYPEAKRMVEALCAGFAGEYSVPAKVVRLTQTFGVGIRSDDSRVFAQFARAALRGEDIILLTDGGTSYSYLYTADAVTAIFVILLCGGVGEAYNVANEQSYCSIREMAELVATMDATERLGYGVVNVYVKESEDAKKLYPPKRYIDLDTQKLRKLGWNAKYLLEEMFRRMMEVHRGDFC